MTPIDPALDDVARGLLAEVLGRDRITRLEALQVAGPWAVLRVTLPGSGRRLVLKVAGADGGPVDFERTAAASALARAAGVPAAAVLAADDSGRAGRPRYLLTEYVDGVEWRRLRPLLDAGQVAGAHRQIAAAVLALHSVRPGAFGELDRDGRVAGGADVVAALHRRVELRIADPDSRRTADRVLDRDAHLLAGVGRPTLCHDDLHHGNVLFRPVPAGWQLAALLDWDKSWAGPGESDVARMAFWDDMTGPAFWEVYRAAVPVAEGEPERALIHQLLWCLEYDDGSARHAADTAALRRRLGVG